MMKNEPCPEPKEHGRQHIWDQLLLLVTNILEEEAFEGSEGHVGLSAPLNVSQQQVD